jgi:hypothetical protein
MRALSAVALAAALLAASPVLAHHSSAMFDRARTVTLKGTIKEYQFVAPHSWISVIVPGENGSPEARWDVEGATASRMAAQGITPAKLKVGEKVTIRAHPLRDGRNGAALIDLTLEDGTVFVNNTTKLQIGQ